VKVILTHNYITLPGQTASSMAFSSLDESVFSQAVRSAHSLALGKTPSSYYETPPQVVTFQIQCYRFTNLKPSKKRTLNMYAEAKEGRKRQSPNRSTGAKANSRLVASRRVKYNQPIDGSVGDAANVFVPTVKRFAAPAHQVLCL
jgi:hypothetical protein